MGKNISQFFRDPALSLVEAPALEPAEIALEEDQIALMQKELDEAKEMALPEDENDDF